MLPVGMAPRPALRYLSIAQHEALLQDRFTHVGGAARLLLEQQLAPLYSSDVSHAILEQVCQGLSTNTLLAALLKDLGCSEQRCTVALWPIIGIIARRSTALCTHADLAEHEPADGTGAGELLYDTHELVFGPSQRMEIWVRIAPDYADDAWLAKWKACFELVLAQGIGARKSVGMGACRLLSPLTPTEAAVLPESSSPRDLIFVVDAGDGDRRRWPMATPEPGMAGWVVRMV
ncbi:MAG: hypothetical protein R2911_28330 [Caldilineaceae bacterium]